MTKRDKHIGVRVSEAEKMMFEEHIEDTGEFDSVPRMMRTLCRDHIDGYGEEDAASIDSDEIVNAVEVGLSSVHERLEEMENKIAELDAEIRVSDEDAQLGKKIISELPVYTGAPDFPDPGELDTGSVDSVDTAKALSTSGAWAQYFGISDDEARSALARANEFPDVDFIKGPAGHRRYYKKAEGI